jgi:hypothetical protein
MSWSFERRLLIAAAAVWIAIAIAMLALAVPLGHDEAAIAMSARGDAPADWLYRSRGLVALARLGVLAGGAEWQLRLPIAVLDAGVVFAVFAVARAAFGAAAGAWAAAVVAGAHWMVLRSAELLGDLPAAACTLAALALVVTELGRADGPRWRLVLAAPLLAAAFYVRYGTLPVIAVAGVAAALLWWRSILRRPGPVLAAIALFAALLVPHVLDSLASTGRALGILEISRATPRRAYLGEGLVTYLTANPFRYYGALVAPVALAGLVGVVRARRRAAWYLWLVAVGQIVALGLQSHGQPRYIFIATALLVVLGVDAVRAAIPAARGALLRRAALVLVAAAWAVAAIAVVLLHHVLIEARAPMVSAAETVRRDAAGGRCIVASRAAPQLAWYTGCTPVRLVEEAAFDPWPRDRRQYIVGLPGSSIDVAAVAATQRAIPVELPASTARVWRLTY